MGFTKEYDRVLGVRRKTIFTERFSFQGEFEKMAAQNVKPEALKFLFEPLMNPDVRKSFNPLRAFESQRILKNKQEEDDSPDDKTNADRVTKDDLTRNRVKGNFIFYAERLLELLDTPEKQVYLRDFCSQLVRMYSEDSVYNGDFVSFIIEMNRDKGLGEFSRVIRFSDGKIQQDGEMKTIEEVFAKAVLNVQMDGKVDQVAIKSFPEEEVEILPGLKITNMLFIGECKL